jgi:Homeodomain-like domain
MKTDGRALNHAMLTELRKRGVAAVQSGESPTQVAAALGVNLRSLFRWLALYRCTGVADGISWMHAGVVDARPSLMAVHCAGSTAPYRARIRSN